MKPRNWLAWKVLLVVALPLAASQPSSSDSPAQTQGEDPRGVVATVNGEPVYFEDVERQLNAAHSSVGDIQRSAPDLDRLMERLIDDALLAQEARAMGLDEETALVEQVGSFRRNLARDRLEREEIQGRVQIADEEIQEVFTTDYATVTFRMITAAEREQAEELWNQVRDGSDFEAMAREQSIDQHAARGGLLEKIDRIDLPPEMIVAIWAAGPGGITEPVRTALGWTVLRVDTIEDADPERLDGLRGHIRDQIRFRKSEQLRAALDRSLRDSLSVSIDKERLNAIGCERLPDGRLIPQVEEPTAVVARIGERSILADELGRALKKRWKGVRNEEAALAARSIVLSRLVRSETMYAEALRRGYGDDAPARRALGAFERQLLVRRYIREVVSPGVDVTPEQIEAHYLEHRSEYGKPPRLHLGQITVADEEEAERMAELLRQGTDLAWLARRHSIDRFKDSGGLRGWMTPSRGLDQFQDALAEAQAGDVLGPGGDPGNYVVLQVVAREDQGIYSQEEMAGAIRPAVFALNFQVYLVEYLQKLRERSEIEIDHEVLAAMRISGAPTDPGTEAPAATQGNR